MLIINDYYLLGEFQVDRKDVMMVDRLEAREILD